MLMFAWPLQATINVVDYWHENLGRVVDKARSLGGIPVLCTPVSRHTFGADGRISNSFDGYPDFDPSRPDTIDDFTLPKNPARNTPTPLGN